MAGIVGLTEIQHQNGTSAMTIDANGRMSKGVQVFWVLGYNGNSQVEGTLVFDNQYKMINCTYNASTGEVTVPMAGIYMCTFTSNNDNAYKHFKVNGSNPYSSFSQWHNGADSNTLVVPLQLSANDVVTAYMHTAGGGTYGSNTLFTGTFLG